VPLGAGITDSEGKRNKVAGTSAWAGSGQKTLSTNERKRVSVFPAHRRKLFSAIELMRNVREALPGSYFALKLPYS
jgi:hypothetical protein